MANTSTDILAAIDAGSSKVLCVIARPSDTLEGCFKVLGFGRVPSQGIKNGIIYDVEKAVFSIRTALQEAQNTAGVSVRTVWPAIGGSVVTSANARGAAGKSGRKTSTRPCETPMNTAASSRANGTSSKRGCRAIAWAKWRTARIPWDSWARASKRTCTRFSPTP